jgi:hypothetical protein
MAFGLNYTRKHTFTCLLGRTPSFEDAGSSHQSLRCLPANAAPSIVMLSVAIIDNAGSPSSSESSPLLSVFDVSSFEAYGSGTNTVYVVIVPDSSVAVKTMS